jgi:hypothetical protein
MLFQLYFVQHTMRRLYSSLTVFLEQQVCFLDRQTNYGEQIVDCRMIRHIWVCRIHNLPTAKIHRPVDNLKVTEPSVLEQPASSATDKASWERDCLAAVPRALAEGGTVFLNTLSST